MAQAPPDAGGVILLRSAPDIVCAVRRRSCPRSKQGAERQMKVFSRLTAIAADAARCSPAPARRLPGSASRRRGRSAAGFGHAGHGRHHRLPYISCSGSSPRSRSSFWSCSLIIIVRFNARANPTPTRTTHNTLLEVIWTIVPVIILVAIAVPSFRLLFIELDVPKPDLTMKATGKQWFWSYAYPDNGNFEFNSLMVAEKDLKPGQPRLLDGRQRDGRAGEQGRARAGDRRRRDPFLHRAVIRHQDRRHSGPHQRHLVQGDDARACSTANAPNCAARTIRSCRSRCGSSSDKRLRRLGRAGEAEIRRRGRALRRTTLAAAGAASQ